MSSCVNTANIAVIAVTEALARLRAVTAKIANITLLTSFGGS